MKNGIKIKFLILLSIFIFFPIVFLEGAIENPLKCDTITECIGLITEFIFSIAIVLLPLVIAIAAFFLLTSGGDPEKVRTAKRVILWGCIGLAIVLFARGIISLIESIIEG